jgi:CheY-like chemotaxis protein
MPHSTVMTVGTDPKDSDFAEHYPLRLLVADDIEVNRRLLKLMLRGLGYEPLLCCNGRECYDMVVREPFDLLLTDIDMPEMNGIECARALRLAGFDLPILAITASAADAARVECLDAGMAGFMRKPISLPELKRSLREVSLRKWLQVANRAVSV